MRFSSNLLHPAALPHSSPPLSGFAYAGSCRSALEASGDLCEVVPLSDDLILLVMADVMGKGLPAAVIAGTLRTMIHALAHPQLQPADCLAELNELMFDELSSAEAFVTLQLVVADLGQRELVVANAGHCPLFVSDGVDRFEVISPYGIPLGIEPETAFCSECVELGFNSSVLLYTDGVTEARDPAGNLFGQRRLERWFHDAVAEGQTAAEIKTNLLEELSSFQGSDRGDDDQSLLVLCDESSRKLPRSMTANLGWLLHWRHAKPNRGRFIKIR